MKTYTKLVFGFILFCLFNPSSVLSQNLVRNSGFENVVNPSCNLTSDSAGFRAMIQDWSLATKGTADLRTTLVGQNCLTHCVSTHPNVHGRQAPYEGNVMVGLYTYSMSGGGSYREYVTIELLDTMHVGETYYGEMYISRAENFALSSNNIGMYFSDVPIYEESVENLKVTPQINYTNVITDTSGWVKVSGEIVPTKPLKYLVIGNFYDNANTTTVTLADPTGKSFSAYYFVDVVLVKKGPARPSIDTVVCEGDSLQLQPQNETVLGWSLKDDPNTIISTAQSLWVSPIQKQIFIMYGQKDTVEYHVDVKPKTPKVSLGADTVNLCGGEKKELNLALKEVNYLWQDGTTDSFHTLQEPGQYWLEVTNSCGTNSDTIVVVDDQCDCYVYVPNAFTPNADSLNERFAPVTDCDPSEYHLLIYNRWGEMLFQSFEYEHKWGGAYRGVPVPEGVYFWILYISEDQGGITIRKPMSGTVTLMR